ncbi:MAG: mechanosensitive ion channel family protein [Candidatus Thermoplasmatota archaeon]|nr:mechanosensitive ion channel family protein [Candidatus Thermoplasmatota archaeon]
MAYEEIIELLTRKLPFLNISIANILMAIIIIIIGYFVAIIVSKYVAKVMKKAKMSKILVEFTSRILRILLIIFVISIAVGYLGVDIGAAVISISVVAGFIFGFAFQETLGNLAAGFMIAITKPFKKNDYVEVAGHSGRINNVGASITSLTTLDNKRIIIPNSKVWGEPIVNYTALSTRMIDMRVGISYGDDIGKAIKVAMDVVKKHEKVLDDPAPYIGVADLGDSSVNLLMRPWVNTDDYWITKWDLTRNLKEAYDKEGISIPFPQRDLWIKSQNTMELNTK